MHVRRLSPWLLLIVSLACADEQGRRGSLGTPFGPVGDEDVAMPDLPDDEDTAMPDRPDDHDPPAFDLPDSPQIPTVACYPGPMWDWSACLPVVSPDGDPEGYAYPKPMPASDNYRAPVAYLDLNALDPDTMLAPSFRLGELARAWKGRFAVIQPHAVEKLQALRDDIGPIKVHSGYRPPTYNAMIGGAMFSRHLYGDAFDMEPLESTLFDLEDLCVAHDGHLFEYDTHVHCDWRDDALDEVFFGPPG